MTATDCTEDLATDGTERTDRPCWFARLIPAADRDAIVGDLLEEAALRQLTGLRRRAWLDGECGAIALGLSFDRARAWFVLPPMREIAAGIALDGRGSWRGGHGAAAIGRGLAFCATVATLAFGVELLVGTLLRAAGL